MAAGDGFTCALLSEGRVRCWGSDGGHGRLGYGELGVDVTVDAAADLQLGGKSIQITAGYNHACALLESGNVRCWGDGVAMTPVEAGNVEIGAPAIAVSAGAFHTCVLMHDGGGRWWGLETNEISGSTDVVTDIRAFERDAVQVVGGKHHTCALLLGGSVRCWGTSGSAGTLGYGNSDSQPNASTLPDVPLGGAAKHIVAGDAFSCALLESGTVRCWGNGLNGRLGYGNTENIGDNETPAAAGDVDVGGEVLGLAAGEAHVCALLTGDAIRCWGSNEFGQLGYGHTEDIGDDETPASVGDVPYR